jgi:hypothetical protein
MLMVRVFCECLSEFASLDSAIELAAIEIALSTASCFLLFSSPHDLRILSTFSFHISQLHSFLLSSIVELTLRLLAFHESFFEGEGSAVLILSQFLGAFPQ